MSGRKSNSRKIGTLLSAVMGLLFCLFLTWINIETMKENERLREQVKILQSLTAQVQSDQGQAAGNRGIEDISAGMVLEEELLNQDQLSLYFTAAKISKGDAVYNRINGKSYRENDRVGLSDLRYIKLLHYNFDHKIQVGELITNKNIAEDILAIFKELYQEEYEIESMRLIDDYWTGEGESSDNASIEKNNTSAFCYREITGGKKLSNHAYGLAIDINPRQNPYVKTDPSGKENWNDKNADNYINREKDLPHMISHEDLAFKVFTRYSFGWGGDWNNPKDYQHFEKPEAR